MAVAYDTSGRAEDFAVTTLTTASMSIAATADRVALVCLSTTVNPGAITAMSLGGVNGSAVASAAGDDANWFHILYKVLDPPSGSQTATFTWTNSAAAAVVTALVFNGADDVNGGNYVEEATPVDISISSNAGDLTATFIGDNFTDTGHTTNQTERVNGTLISADTGTGGAGPITHTWTLSPATAGNIVGANVTAAGGGGVINSKTTTETLTMTESVVQLVSRWSPTPSVGLIARITRRIPG